MILRKCAPSIRSLISPASSVRWKSKQYQVELHESFNKFNVSFSRSLLKKYLKRPLLYKLMTARTPVFNCNFLDVVKSGFENLDSKIGAYCPDADSYVTYAELFDQIIKDYHNFRPIDKQPFYWGNPKSVGNLDNVGNLAKYVRISCSRSMFGFPFHPRLTRDQYQQIEQKLYDSLNTMGGELKGTYYPLNEIDGLVKEHLREENLLFTESDKFLKSAKAYRHWPVGRGIFISNRKNLVVWCNEEDHICVISYQRNGHIGETYGRIVAAMKHLSRKIKFNRHYRLGFLTFCPSKIGTGIKTTVCVRLPRLTRTRDQLIGIADKHGLDVHVSSLGMCSISNKVPLGKSEYALVKSVYRGVLEMMIRDKKL